MTISPQERFARRDVELTWTEEPAGRPISVTCWFERDPLWHVLKKHVCTREPWGRILNGSLIQRLAREVGAGRLPSRADCEEFIESLATQLKAGCAKPLLCRSREAFLPEIGGARLPVPAVNSSERTDKVLVVLSSGAVAFLRFASSPFEDRHSTVFLTAFFPRQATWVVPARAAAASAARYVQRWAKLEHSSGGLLLPEFGETVEERDEETGEPVQRRLIRFITPENWGFRREPDGEMVWNG